MATEYKLSYTASEINSKLGKIDSKADISAIPTKTSELTNDSGFLISIPAEYVTETELSAKGYLTGYTETDPTVPAWAKAATKPTYTASEVGALPDTTVIPEAVVLDATLSTEGQAADAKATGDSLNKKLNNNLGTENAGKLLYVSADGTIMPLSLGEGLEIANGVLKLTGSVTPDTETEITVVTDDSGNLTILADGVEVEPTIDENGNLTYSGLGIVLDANGNMTLEKEA